MKQGHPRTKNEDFIKFLGTAGARYVVARQLRYSGGIFLHLKGKNVVIDPGPGTLVRLARSRPPIDITKLDAIILTHIHIDHSNDVNVLIDAMTSGGFHRHGILFAPDECVNGEDRVVLRYLRGFVSDIKILKPETRFAVGDLSFSTSVPHEHSAETYGIMFNLNGTRVAFMSDTKFFPGLVRSYRAADVLVINVVFFAPHENAAHLSLEDVAMIVREIKPRKVILTHLGLSMVRVRPRELSERLTRELGTDITVATDGMTVYLDHGHAADR
jgi:ribonuclease BN (tRNA processing enzyme)